MGGEDIAGGKLKETGTIHWTSPNNKASNETNFTALPGGKLDLQGAYSNTGTYCYFWSTTEDNATNSWYHLISNGYSNMYRYSGGQGVGYSVRCVKNKISSPQSVVQ